MDIIKFSYLCFFIIHFSVAQEKEDAYFIIDNNDDKYLVKGSVGGNLNKSSYEKISAFVMYDKIEYEKYYTKERKEAEMHMLKSGSPPKTFFFKVKKKEKITLNNCDLNSLNIVNYKWIREHSWKKIDPIQEAPFNNLFFLYKVSDTEYMQYKVRMIIVEY